VRSVNSHRAHRQIKTRAKKRRCLKLTRPLLPKKRRRKKRKNPMPPKMTLPRKLGAADRPHRLIPYLVYDAPLTDKQADAFELRAAPGNPGEKTAVRDKAQTAPKPIMEQLAEAAKNAPRGDPAATDKKQNRDER